LPVPVILNRLATDFLVLIPLGRLIKSSSLQKSAHYRWRSPAYQAVFWFFWNVKIPGLLEKSASIRCSEAIAA